VTRQLAVSLRRTASLLGHRLSLENPLALALRIDPGLAEREDTTPEDHAVADVLLAIDHLVDALDDWQSPSQ
jgi:hypothetical protein